MVSLAFADEEDELIGASLQQAMRATKRAYDALQLEKHRLESKIAQRQITDDEIARIKEMAARIKDRIDQPLVDMKRRF